MSKAKASGLPLNNALFVTRTSKLHDQTDASIPRGRLVSGSAAAIDSLLKSGQIRPATESDITKARQFFQKPVRLKD